MPDWTKKNFNELEDRSPPDAPMQWRFARPSAEGSTSRCGAAAGRNAIADAPDAEYPSGPRSGQVDPVESGFDPAAAQQDDSDSLPLKTLPH